MREGTPFDGEKVSKETAEKVRNINKQINDELALMQSNIPGLNVQVMMKDIIIESKAVSIIELLIEKEIITEDEISLLLAENVLEVLRQVKSAEAKNLLKPDKGIILPFGGKK